MPATSEMMARAVGGSAAAWPAGGEGAAGMGVGAGAGRSGMTVPHTLHCRLPLGYEATVPQAGQVSSSRGEGLAIVRPAGKGTKKLRGPIRWVP